VIVMRTHLIPNAVRNIAAGLAAVLSLFVPASAFAQTLDVQIQPSRVYVGDTATLQIVIPDADDDVTPIAFGRVDGLNIEYVGSGRNTQMSIINGRRTVVNDVMLNYSVTPMASGEYVIPSQQIKVGGKSLRTSAVRLTVLDPPSGNSDLVVELQDDHAYVGQPVRMRLTWYVGENAEQGFRFASGVDQDDFDDLGVPDSSLGGADTLQAIYGNEQVSAPQGSATRNGMRYTTVTVDRVLILKRAGTMRVGPARVRYSAVVGTRGFGLFQQNETEPRVAESSPATLEVLPLPTEGRPEGFTGLVGRSFTITSSASAKTVNVGDPIELTVRVHGEAPMERVRLAPPAEIPALAAGFKVSDEPWEAHAGDTINDRVYTTTVRASSESVKEIPPITLSYFNAESGSYSTAASASIPLTVRKTHRVTAADAVGGGGAAPAAAAAPVLESIGAGANGVLGITVSDAALQDEHTGGLTQRAWLLVLIIAPALAPLVVLGAGWIRRDGRPAEIRRRRRALRRALAELNSPGDPRVTIDRAVRAYVSDRFDRPAEALTYADCRTLLMRDGSESGEAVGRLLAQCSAERFGGEAVTPSIDEARRLLRNLEREGRS